MEIEKEIKQSKFKSEHQKLFINLIYTANSLYLKNNCKLRAYELTGEQFNVLRILRGQFPKPATVNLITERMLNKNSNASRLVEKLRTKNLIERAECPEDRRAVNILITEEGLELLKRLDKEKELWTNDLKTLSEAEAMQLNLLLNKLRG